MHRLLSMSWGEVIVHDGTFSHARRGTAFSALGSSPTETLGRCPPFRETGCFDGRALGVRVPSPVRCPRRTRTSERKAMARVFRDPTDAIGDTPTFRAGRLFTDERPQVFL